MVTHADGRISTREEVLRDFDTGMNRLLEGQIDELRIRSFGAFAIVHGRTRARGEYKGHDYDVTLRFTDVFKRQDEDCRRWLPMPRESRLKMLKPKSPKRRNNLDFAGV